MTVVAIIQARMGSSRLPGKSLLPLAGKPLIQHVIERAQAATMIDSVLVATSTDALDDPLAAFVGEQMGVAVFRGHPTDVLDRYAGAARTVASEVIVRLTGDDPIKDPAIIDMVVGHFMRHSGRYDYVSNNNPPTYPEGLDVEVFPRALLIEAAAQAQDPYEREHVTPFLYRQPQRYRTFSLALADEDHSRQRWTLDTDEDRRFFEALFACMPHDRILPWREVLRLLWQHPEISALNAAVRRSAQYLMPREMPSP